MIATPKQQAFLNISHEEQTHYRIRFQRADPRIENVEKEQINLTFP
jgi:hypothetical protein